MKTLKILFILFVSISFFSCQKDDLEIDETNEEEFVSLGDFVSDENDSMVFLKGYIRDILFRIEVATCYGGIPEYVFRCHENYKYSYRHIKQPDNSSCSWTSYVICAGNICSAFGQRYYPVTLSQMNVVKRSCNGSSLITSLANYAITRDGLRARVVSLPKYTTSYLSVIKEMMNILEIDRIPFLAITKSGTRAHYVIVYSIHWNGDLPGSKIYFTDPLDKDNGSFEKNVKSMDLDEFLYRMKTNSNSNYNFLQILP